MLNYADCMDQAMRTKMGKMSALLTDCRNKLNNVA